MAMVVQDCVVILLRSPPSNVYKPTLSIDENQQKNEQDLKIHGLRVQRIRLGPRGSFSSSSTPMVQYAPSWIPIGAQSLCCMTGLAMDVEHVTRVLQKFADDEYNVFDIPPTTYSMTQSLAKLFRDVCLVDGTRPYGVQAMMIGCDDVDPHQRGGLCMYSIDPSGTWQSWGKACAIGKFGREVRGLLGKKLRSMPATSLSSIEVPQALEHLVECWNEICKQQNINQRGDDDWEILILQKDPRNGSKRCLYTLSKEETIRIFDSNAKQTEPKI
ncbi:MAG: hypothetical protein SGILL_000224 [Bacillariaceae sp.]